MQVFVMWVLLPPVFLICGILAFLAPVLYGESKPVVQIDAKSKHGLADEHA
jgi:hypothetical protein